MRQAMALLDEAGWAVGSDGMRRNAAGEVLRVEILNDDVGNDRIINPFVQNLRAIGIDAVNRRVDIHACRALRHVLRERQIAVRRKPSHGDADFFDHEIDDPRSPAEPEAGSTAQDREGQVVFRNPPDRGEAVTAILDHVLSRRRARPDQR